MKKIISVLVILGFVWMFAVPSFAEQEQKKKFKSELDDIKNPKEARWILMGCYNAEALIATGSADEFIEYTESGKLTQWFLEGHFVEEELMQFASAIIETIEHVWAAAKLLNLENADKGIPTMVWQSRTKNKLYQGTLKDVKEAEKHLFEAAQLFNKRVHSPISELISKDRDKKLKEELKKKKEKQSKN